MFYILSNVLLTSMSNFLGSSTGSRLAARLGDLEYLVFHFFLRFLPADYHPFYLHDFYLHACLLIPSLLNDILNPADVANISIANFILQSDTS